MGDLFAKAYTYAVHAHMGQLYGGNVSVPYTHHLIDVVQVLTDYSITLDYLLAAAMLHDVVEDTDVSIKEVYEQFGDEVGSVVEAVTKPPGPRRRVEKTYLQQIQGHRGAILVKLADRIANVEHSWQGRDSQLFMYYDEYPLFRSMLLDPKLGRESTEYRLWDRLDALLHWHPSMESRR